MDNLFYRFKTPEQVRKVVSKVCLELSVVNTKLSQDINKKPICVYRVVSGFDEYFYYYILNPVVREMKLFLNGISDHKKIYSIIQYSINKIDKYKNVFGVSAYCQIRFKLLNQLIKKHYFLLNPQNPKSLYDLCVDSVRRTPYEKDFLELSRRFCLFKDITVNFNGYYVNLLINSRPLVNRKNRHSFHGKVNVLVDILKFTETEIDKLDIVNKFMKYTKSLRSTFPEKTKTIYHLENLKRRLENLV